MTQNHHFRLFDLNLRLGFQPQPADVDWQKVGPLEGIAGA
jgi:hypothetical protein